jgi:LPXTG-motif cell wall-anchored protein
MITGLALVVLASVAGADEGTDEVGSGDVVAQATAGLHGAHVGSTNPGFTTENCPAPTNTTNFAGDWAWHFVLAGGSDFVTLTVVFDAAPHTDVTLPAGTDSDPSDNITITGGVGVAFVASPNTQHAYVYTPGPDYMLISGTATITGDDTEFNLSHVCPGTTTTTTVAPTTTTVAPTTTTVAPTTTTVAPTTTTTLVSPTTVTNVTTTTSTSTPPQTLSVAAGTASLPRTGGGPSLPLLIAGIGLTVGGAALLLASRRMSAGGTEV